MIINVLTLFPEMFTSPFGQSVIGRAIKNQILTLNLHNLRQWAWNRYGAVDDRPFGGGVGMLIRVDVIDRAINQISSLSSNLPSPHIILTSAKGKRFTQSLAEKWAKKPSLLFICGRYEGVDQRVADHLVDDEVSLGDFVLSGGELAAMAMIDATVRLIPGVLGKDQSSKDESYSLQQIGSKKVRLPEYPQYTRPADYQGHPVPQELLSGNPKSIADWRLNQTKRKQKDSK